MDYTELILELEMGRKSNYTMKDIAEIAEVSRATVDRVIHGRGKVSKKAYEKIKYVLDSIDYKPNFLASSLKKGNTCKIAVLLPDFEFDIYWKRALDGINNSLKTYEFLGLSIDKYLFNPFKTASFKYNSRLILESNYNGVLVVPFFYKESMDFFKKCNSVGLPYATFNTLIEGSAPLCHIGQDLIQSGKTAASLFNKIIDKDNELLILHIDEDIANSKHMQEKEIGFKQFFSEKNFNPNKVSVLKVGNALEIEKQLVKSLDKNNKIAGIFVSTSKVHFAADVKYQYSLKQKLIGYDLIEKNVSHLKSGIIDFLLYQNPKSQANHGISLLVDYLIFKKKPANQKFLPIEIVVKENFDNYLQS